jgi:hypothetical protein
LGKDFGFPEGLLKGKLSAGNLFRIPKPAIKTIIDAIIR